MKRYGGITAIAAVVVLLDQLTKWLVLEKMPLLTGFPVIEGLLNIIHVQNRGAAFGFLNRSDIAWQFWLFSGATLVALAGILLIARGARPRSYALFSALGLLLGGAIGNFIDRVRFRYVIDFIDVYWKDKHWPAFNVADIAICCGIGLVLICTFFGKNTEKNKHS